MRRTKAEVDDETAQLQALRDKVPHYTLFSDDNHAAIDIQISSLRGEVGEDDLNEQAEDGDITDNERDEGIAACQWLEGESDDAPSAGWAELVDITKE